MDTQNVACPRGPVLCSLTRKEALTRVDNAEAPEGVILSDISQTHKDKRCVTHLQEVPGGVRATETAHRTPGARAGGGGVLHGESQFGKMESSGNASGEGCATV